MTSNNEYELQSLKLLIVEDHPVYLEGLMFTLESLAETVKIESVNSLEQAKNTLSNDTSYDLILLDLNLSDGIGLSLLRYIQTHKLFIPVAILSGSENHEDVEKSLSFGASGYISKAAGRSEILSSIKQVLNGDTCLPNFFSKTHSVSQPENIHLTPRQLEVLQLVAEGLPNKQICRTLELTDHTVKTHLKSLFQIFGVHNRTECAKAAAELGFINT